MTQKRTPNDGGTGERGGQPMQETRGIQDRPLGQARRQPPVPDHDRPVVRRAANRVAPQSAAPSAQPRRNAENQNPNRDPNRDMRRQAPQGQPRQQGQGQARRPVPEMRYQPRQSAPVRQERIDPSQRDPDQEYAFQAKQQRRAKQRRMRRTLFLVALVVLVLGAFSAKLALDLGSGTGTFYEGISVDGLKLNGYTKEAAKAQLESLNTQRMNDMTVLLSYSGREWSVSPEQLGVALNIDEILDQAWQMGREGNIFARQKQIGEMKKAEKKLITSITYDEAMLTSRLSEVKASVDVAAVDAVTTFDPSKEEKFKITQESNGRSVDLNALVSQVKTQLNNGFTSTIEVKPDVVLPTVLAADLEKATKRIVRTTTDLGSSTDARIHNVKTAVNLFNGMTLQPGQEVSFNQITGPRTTEQGYKDAGIIVDDEIVDGPGGGVCQASTTLYQAVVKSNLEIVRSNKHSMPVSYVDVGTDAAVAYDYKDLIFKNNTKYPIFIEGKVSGKTVAISIYGYPLDEGTTIEIVTDVYETIQPAETKTILDTTAEFVTYTDETAVKKKSREGIKVKSYRVIKVNGEETSREMLRNDYYKEVQGEIYQGVTPREGTTPTSPEPSAPAGGGDD